MAMTAIGMLTLAAIAAVRFKWSYLLAASWLELGVEVAADAEEDEAANLVAFDIITDESAKVEVRDARAEDVAADED